MGGIKNKPPPGDTPRPRSAPEQELRGRVRLRDDSLEAQTERMATALRDMRTELVTDKPGSAGEQQYRALVTGLKEPPPRPAAKGGAAALPAEPLPQAKSASPRLMRALSLRGAFKGVLRKRPAKPAPATPDTAGVGSLPKHKSAPAALSAEPRQERDPLHRVGDALRAKVRARVAQALDDPTPAGLRGALDDMLLFEAPDAAQVQAVRHMLLAAELQADPVRPDALFEVVHDFVRHNPPVDSLDYAIFENAPVLYTAFAGQAARTPTLAAFFKQVCAAQFADDDYLPDDPRIEAIERLCRTNDACLAYFAEGKRSMRLLVLGATGLTRDLLRQARQMRADYKGRS